MSENRENIGNFFEVMKSRFERCLEPKLSCNGSVIKAHSVQNAVALDLISENNHVYEIRPRFGAEEPDIRFRKIGRNQASTFTGFCATHDSEIFRPIDTQPISIENKHQLFLVAYRSVSRELHVVLEGAMHLQAAYQAMIESGQVPKDAVSAPAVAATQHMMKAWGVWKYRYSHYDKALVSGAFDTVLHSAFLIEDREPVIACSSFFSVDDKPWGKSFSAVCLNIVPLSARTSAVVVSYPKAHSGLARKYVSPIFLKSGDDRLLELSRLIVDRAENFFVSPKHLESWPEKKRLFIETKFVETVSHGRKVERSDELFLF